MWADRVAAQRASGQSVRTFCREQAIGEHSFYSWRKRLRSTSRVEFALVEAKPVAAMTAPTTSWAMEVSLAGGALIRIAKGADPSMLRLVLDALRT